MQHGRSYHIIDRPDKTEVRKGKISHDRAVLHIPYEVSTWAKKSLHLDNMKLEMGCRGEEEHSTTTVISHPYQHPGQTTLFPIKLSVTCHLIHCHRNRAKMAENRRKDAKLGLSTIYPAPRGGVRRNHTVKGKVHLVPIDQLMNLIPCIYSDF